MLALYIGCGVKHLLHTRPALWTFMSDHHHIAALHLITKNAVHGSLLRSKDPGRTAETEYALIHTGSLHHTAVLCDIALEHSESAILDIGMFHIADTACGTVSVKLAVIAHLTSELGGAPHPRGTLP